ncbi:cysteine and glycine-rich protein 2-like isoform X2 [Spodoptera litura]|uniref:Cysteine and glycine-rich protein 2-like isoform X2 n=1 Tax=Spodoptera litura TaxID=69820 RepID=A0A9J7EAN6_SPOLT|nr:cysteine and glycine-rich protein 2-like isoform X2 [Spodoptera litura]
MDKTQEPAKKCFCARCFLPVDPEDRVDIEGHSFHRLCSMCCVCRTIPPSLKMFYGHVFCNECFKTHVLSRFRGESPRIHSNSWWMQWAPNGKPQEAATDDNNNNNKEETKAEDQPAGEEPPKRCICARCLQCVDESNKVDVGGQSFHPQCAKCYFCHTIPTDNIKIYYGQVFCEDCFNKHVLNRNKDNPAEFFKNCFDQWQNNAQFAENMREFLAGNKDNSPFIFMMQGQQPPFCRCGSGPQEWFQNNEPKKCVQSSTVHPLTEDERDTRVQSA